jgi:hypothetical protein
MITQAKLGVNAGQTHQTERSDDIIGALSNGLESLMAVGRHDDAVTEGLLEEVAMSTVIDFARHDHIYVIQLTKPPEASAADKGFKPLAKVVNFAEHEDELAHCLTSDH